MRMQIGAFLVRRLAEVGVRHIFGVPGDFNLSLLEQIQVTKDIEFVGNCNELNAAYAADGYARTSGLAAFVTTFGVGDLGAISGIAGSYAENVPVVHITGTPPLHAVNSRALVHHTLVDGDYDNIGRCMAEFTVAQARITPANAAFEIDRVLKSCWLERRPVHLQLPSDVTHIVVEVPAEPLVLADPISDPEQLRLASQRIIDMLESARFPAIVVDADADRFGVTDLVRELAEKCNIPCASLTPAKSALDETSKLYVGTYAGAASAESVRTVVENADCLIGVGLRFTDTSTALFSQRIDHDTFVDLRRHDLSIGATQMPGVTLKEVLAKVVAEIKPANRPRAIHAPTAAKVSAPVAANGNGALTQTALWSRIGMFLRPADVLIGEAGTSHAALSSMRLPRGATYIAQPIWGAIGYTLPALFGSLVGASARRHLLFIGDGSFQLTAQELSSILRRDLKPVIFLLNNDGYTIERLILGENSAYNDVANWRYAELPHVLDRHERALSLVVENVAELDAALEKAASADQLVFIELKLSMMDAPESLKKFADLFADFDYGERGPRNPSTTAMKLAQSHENRVLDKTV
ncbi:thiamine pyrophosphate-binding protein [Paraburkholderia sediminicola]|uniref:alpha-keto acid decarboxylase family protein n=1 Tax=Paraburkholderia sediminicola TaxID=458836 RepID=UPI0038BBF7BC